MSDWKSVRVVDVAVPRGLVGGPFGSSLGTKDYVESGVPVIRGVNLGTDRKFDSSEFVFVTSEKFDRVLARNSAEPGDVVFTQRGTLGQVGIVPPAPHDRYVISQSQMRLRVNSELATADFIYYQFKSSAMHAEISNHAITTGVPHINLGILGGLKIILPPLGVQRGIVAVLSALDDKIAVNDRIAKTAFDISDSRYLQIIQGVTRAETVGDLIDLKYGKALSAAARVEGKIPVYGSGGLTGTHDRPLVEGPGIIVGRKGTVGAVYWSETDFFPIDTTFFVGLRRHEMPMEFVFYMLRHLGLGSMNSDSAVPGLNRSNALALKTRVPGEAEIQRFRNETRSLFSLRESLAGECVSLAALRDTLLPKLMSGEIRVRDAEKVVEDVT